jgi:hypothetical protein
MGDVASRFAAEAGSIETNQNAPSAASVVDSARQRMIAEAAYYRAQKRVTATRGQNYA